MKSGPEAEQGKARVIDRKTPVRPSKPGVVGSIPASPTTKFGVADLAALFISIADPTLGGLGRNREDSRHRETVRTPSQLPPGY